MKSWLFNSYQMNDLGSDIHILSIFLADSAIDGNEFEGDLVNELTNLGPINAIHFTGFPDAIEAFICMLASSESVLLDRLKSIVGDPQYGLLFVSLDKTSGQHKCESIHGKAPKFASVIDYERQNSLLKTFSRSGGEERAPMGTHYAKTSERHSDRFLRVANVLEDSRHVKLLAFWLAPHLWKKEIQHIAVDTSGIYSVVLTALRELAKYGGISGNPALWSYRSHEGVDQISIEIASKALFLVSASTSNGLARRLAERGAATERVVTLFFLSADPFDSYIVLCNLNGSNGDGLQFIVNQDSGDCEWCKNNFHLITIQGDQFSITPPRVTPIEIVASDLPSAAKITLSALAGLKVFYAYRRIADKRLCSLGINVAPLFDENIADKSKVFIERVRLKWSSMKRRSQTVSLRNIVTTAYPGSTTLAKEIADEAGERLADETQVRIVSSSLLQSVVPKSGTSTVVIAPCVDEIQELLSVSRNLRDVQGGGAISYLAVAQMLAPKSTADRLKSNLTYGALGPDTYSLHSAFDLEVQCYEDSPSWREELVALRRMISWADESGFDVPVEVERRINRLEKAVSIGLVNDLYWADINGKPLKLRSDFALLSGALQPPEASQADLFATMCTLLTALREHKDRTKRLANNTYERSVLAPSNFSRFNDGVLQASILRACRGKDLAYGACDELTSQQMLAILMDALPNPSRPEKSEALVEFLLVLLTRRMTLQDKDLRTFAASVIGLTEDTWPVAWLMAQYIESQFSGQNR